MRNLNCLTDIMKEVTVTWFDKRGGGFVDAVFVKSL